MRKRIWRRVVPGLAAVVSMVLVGLLFVPALADGQTRRLEDAYGGGPKPTIVLVHGAWADSSSWDNLISILQREGYAVDAPPNPLRGLTSDSAYLASFLKNISGPIVLVGHSYGGAVITKRGDGQFECQGARLCRRFCAGCG